VSEASEASEVSEASEASEVSEASEASEDAVEIDEGTVEIVPFSSTPTVYTEEALDAAVEGVRRAKTRAVVSYWELGRAILSCFSGSLWKQRRDAEGSPLYKSWSQFCAAELEMSPQYAYRMMDVAATFSSEDVERFGVNKLGIMLRLSENQREKMLEEARAGMPYTTLAEQVRQLSPGPRDTGRKQVGEGKGGRKPKVEAPTNSVTVALTIGRVKVPLFARVPPAKKMGTQKRATRLADDPVGEEILLNGVIQRFVISKDSEGRLILIVERRRASTAEK
jgi:hypothetical protein